jgi:hypothetical protein
VHAGSFHLQLPDPPSFVPDYQNRPGCFDITGRGGLPHISFYSEVTFPPADPPPAQTILFK